MKRLTLALSLAAMTGLAACSEAPTAVNAEPTAAFAKGGSTGGGIGSPHFTLDGTSCGFDSNTGRTQCDYQVSGLGKRGSALVKLEGIIDVDYQCINSVGTVKATRSTIRFVLDATVFADESGNAIGSLSDGPYSVTRLECLVGYFLYNPTNVVFNLNPMAKHGIPILPGEWALAAASLTAKGPGRLFFYSGSLYELVPM